MMRARMHGNQDSAPPTESDSMTRSGAVYQHHPQQPAADSAGDSSGKVKHQHQQQQQESSWRQQYPLRIDSTLLFWAVIIGPLILWWACICAGVSAYEGLPKGQKYVYHLMFWFDRGLLRPAGALLPFAVLGARVAANLLADVWEGSHGTAAAAAAVQSGSGMRRHGGARALSTLAWSCLWVYSLVAAARVVIYLTHLFALKASLLSFHLVSDHLFLGGTMLICLHVEVVCLLSDVMRHSQPRVTLREVGLTLSFVAALCLVVFTSVDMFFTAKYFHVPDESVATAVVVFFLFQAPVLRWLVLQRKRSVVGP